jgi:hypothetical protein
MNQPQIGDCVKGGKDDSYIQVYGFGHYDPDWEDDFVQFHFDDKNSASSPPLEISS